MHVGVPTWAMVFNYMEQHAVSLRRLGQALQQKIPTSKRYTLWERVAAAVAENPSKYGFCFLVSGPIKVWTMI